MFFLFFCFFLENSSPSGKTTTQNIQIHSPVSEKTPVQNPMSPTSPILRKETWRASKYELAKEGGKRVQETPNPKKSLDLSEVEELKGRPVQELFDPENSAAGTLQTNESLQHVEELSEGKPVQETEDPPSEKPKVGIEEQGDAGEEQPIQETQGPGKGQRTGTKGSSQDKGGEEGEVDREEGLETKPLQESASSNVERECTKEDALPTQETMAAGKGPFEETGIAQGTETKKTSQVMEGEALSEGTPLQESANPNVEAKYTKEEVLPTQETMAAGKGPFEETGQAQGTKTKETSQVIEGEEVHEELSERKPLQESARSSKETEGVKEETMPTQETMAAGKGPFEETGQAERSLGKKGEEDHEELSERMPLQESANPNMETKCSKEEVLPTQETTAGGKEPFEVTVQSQGTETEETYHIKEGEEEYVEISDEKAREESANSNAETECTKEETLPTQETMAAGKGPFEETGLEIGVKGQPTDKQ